MTYFLVKYSLLELTVHSARTLLGTAEQSPSLPPRSPWLVCHLPATGWSVTFLPWRAPWLVSLPLEGQPLCWSTSIPGLVHRAWRPLQRAPAPVPSPGPVLHAGRVNARAEAWPPLGSSLCVGFADSSGGRGFTDRASLQTWRHVEGTDRGHTVTRVGLGEPSATQAVYL